MIKKFLLFSAVFFCLHTISYGALPEENTELDYLKPYKKHKIVILSDNDAYTDLYSDKYYSSAQRIEYISPEWNFHKDDN